MEVDKTIIILAIILLVVLGIFALSQIGGSNDVGGSVSAGSNYLANQYGGGGCGR